jgi:hypothetical protein
VTVTSTVSWGQPICVFQGQLLGVDGHGCLDFIQDECFAVLGNRVSILQLKIG